MPHHDVLHGAGGTTLACCPSLTLFVWERPTNDVVAVPTPGLEQRQMRKLIVLIEFYVVHISPLTVWYHGVTLGSASGRGAACYSRGITYKPKALVRSIAK